MAEERESLWARNGSGRERSLWASTALEATLAHTLVAPSKPSPRLASRASRRAQDVDDSPRRGWKRDASVGKDALPTIGSSCDAARWPARM